MNLLIAVEDLSFRCEVKRLPKPESDLVDRSRYPEVRVVLLRDFGERVHKRVGGHTVRTRSIQNRRHWLY